MADRLECLGHDPIVGGHDDDGDVGDASSAGTHRGERLVARRVEEDHALAAAGDLARADVLGDPATFRRGHVGRPDGVEETRLAVVDVAHDRHDGRARLEQGRIVLLEQLLLGRLGDRAIGLAFDPAGAGRFGLGNLIAELARDERGGITVDKLVDRREDAALDQLTDDVCRVHAEPFTKLLDGDRRRQFDRAAFPRVKRLNAGCVGRAVATRRLAGPATAARAAPTSGHGLLLRSSDAFRSGSRSAPRADPPGARS